ncbi:MAG TPA: recombinase family protein [Herpetosiphonaceae bacterium]|nr:recombinase family protein [Herpetosiphonaceae bacterium]
MRVAIYARVSTTRQTRTQTVEQQLTRLKTHVEQQGWVVEEQYTYVDDGYSGASLSRPGLDRVRDAAGFGELDVLVVTAPDRLARKYVHQVLLLEEFKHRGCRVEFVERPMSEDPNDQLLLQIRGAVAEYERTLITERMRRGRLAKLRAGQLLPWIRVPLGYQVDPDRPRDPQGLRIDEPAAVIVQQIFAWYLEDGMTLRTIATRLIEAGIATPTGTGHWSGSTIRGILHNTAYIGMAYGNCTRQVRSHRRVSALLPVGSGRTCTARPPDDWIPLSVPAIINQEVFDVAQEKLATNRQRASRNNTRHQYLLRSLVSCGLCRLAAPARTTWDGRSYYVCNGHGRLEVEERCRSRHIPADQLDTLVWADLCDVVCHPEQIATALEQAQAGAWLPDELQARRTRLNTACAQNERYQQRLLDAYLHGVLDLAELTRKRHDLQQQAEALRSQEQQLDATARHHMELAAVASSIDAFCQQIQAGLESATFEQRRALVELLIDRVIVTNDDVEIRYVVPTSSTGSHRPFCQLRTDYLHGLPRREV